MTASRSLDLAAVFEVLGRRRRFVTRTLLVFLVLGVALALLLPPTYEAVAVILAPQDDDLFGSLASGRRTLSSLSTLAMLSQTATPSDEYAAILKSDNVHVAIARRFDMMKVYHQKNLDGTLKNLRRHVRITLNSDGTISVAAQDRQRRRAADLANGFVEELERFNQERRLIRGRGQVRFLDAQIESTVTQLRRNEEIVRRFGESRHAPILSVEDKAAAEAAADLLAHRAALEVKRQVLSAYLEPNSDELGQTDNEINSLNREISKLPSLMMEGARLIRDLRVQEELFALLKAQQEQARVKEALDVATVEVLDKARPPDLRAKPNRKLVVAGMLLLGFLTALGGALLADAREGHDRRGSLA